MQREVGVWVGEVGREGFVLPTTVRLTMVVQFKDHAHGSSSLLSW